MPLKIETQQKNKFLNRVIKLNTILFTGYRETMTDRWERYKQLKNDGVIMKMPKNFDFK